MVLCNTLFFWDATAGCASNNAHTPTPPAFQTNLRRAFADHPLHRRLFHLYPRRSGPTTDIFHLEFVGVHAISLSYTPSLVRVNLVRSSGIPALTGHYLVDMLPRDGLSSETKIFVTDSHQNIPLSGFTDLEQGDLLGTFSLIQIPLSALHRPSAVPLPTTLHTTDVHALHDNIPVAEDGRPSTDTQPCLLYTSPSPRD